LQDSHTAKVVDIQATAENAGGEVAANLLDGVDGDEMVRTGVPGGADAAVERRPHRRQLRDGRGEDCPDRDSSRLGTADPETAQLTVVLSSLPFAVTAHQTLSTPWPSTSPGPTSPA
jgi:hypothetical protein